MLVREGFYFLEAKSDEYDSIPLSYLSEEHANNKTQVWLSHFCLGHLSFSSLKRMFPTMFGKLDIQSFHCYVCEFTKHHHVYALQGLINVLFHLASST